MFKPITGFSGFSVKNLNETKNFYSEQLGLEVYEDAMGLQLTLPGAGTVFIYEKPNHNPATFTILNFVVEDIDQTVDELTKKGIIFQTYENMSQDKKGIVRGIAVNRGPDIAWFTDPSGNILSVLQENK